VSPWEREERREVRLLREILDRLTQIVALLSPAQSTTAILYIQLYPPIGGIMSNAVLTFTDATGAPIAPPTGDGSGLVVSFSSSNPAVTIGTAVGSGDTATAPITGTEAFTLAALVANTSGAPLLDNDGVTPFVQPAPISVAATTPPDQAVTAVLSTD
jgi:hypothetical protein